MHKLFFDGGLSGKNLTYGIVIKDEDEVIKTIGGQIQISSHLTSNIAEYTALLFGITTALALEIKEIEIYGDSRTVIEQITKTCRNKYKTNKVFAKIIRNLLKEFDSYQIFWVSRRNNKEADRAGR